MFLRSATEIKKNTIVDASNKLTNPININEKGVNFAWSLANFEGDKMMDDKKYGKYILQYSKYELADNSTSTNPIRDFTITDIPFSQCTNESYVFKDID